MYRRTPVFFRMIDSFFRHQLLFWSALLIVSGLTLGVLYARSKTYHATAMTQVQGETVATVLGAGETNTWTTPAQRNADRFSDLIKQNQPGGFLDSALQKADLVMPIDVDPAHDDPRYALLQKNLSANVESANQFSINLTWDNPQECQAIVNSLQQQFIAEIGIDRSALSTGSVNFLNHEIEKADQRMRRAEKALAEYKASFGGQLSDADSTYHAQITADQADLAQTQRDSDEKTKTAAVLTQQLTQMKPMNIMEQTTSDQSPMEKQIAELLAKREATLASRGGLTPDHPDVVVIDNQIKRLQKQERVNANLPQNQRSTQTKMQDNPQYQSLKLQIAEAEIARDSDLQAMQDLRQRIAKNQSLLNRIPMAQRQLSEKMRDYQEAQTVDQSYRQKRDQVQLQASLDRQTASDSLLPIGVTSAVPTTGKTKMIAMVLGSLLLGCLVGSLLIVLSEWSDHSLRYEADAERLLGVPVLASLPENGDLRVVPHRSALSGGRQAALPGPTLERKS